MNWKHLSKILLAFGFIAASIFLLSSTTTPAVEAQDPPVSEGPTSTYSLTLNKVGQGNVTKSPDKALYDPGEQVTITATADVGWQFTGWTGDVTDTNSPLVITMDGNKTVTANFTQRCYPLTISKSGEGTTPNPSPNNSAGCAAGEYHYGAEITLHSAIANLGWTITGWTGTKDDASTSSSNAVSMPASAHSASVIYSRICQTLTLNVDPNGAGSIARSPLPNCGIDRYFVGTTVQLTANPDSGYAFEEWSGDATGTTNPVTVEMSTNRTVTANFELACYPLTLAHTGNGDDPVATPKKSDGCSDGEYHMGTAINLQANPDGGWQVGSWEGTNNNNSSSNTNDMTMPASSAVVTVNYVVKPTLQFQSETFSVNEDAGEATIKVVRTGSEKETVTVKYYTDDGVGSAAEGVDYESRTGTLTFNANQTTKSFKIDIINDNLSEGTETVKLVLHQASGNARLGDPVVATLNILDDEGTPTVQFSSTTYTINEDANEAEIVISLFPGASQPVFVDFSTSNGTAEAGKDYSAVTDRTVRFNAGQTQKTVKVPIIDDALDEPDETVNLTLSGVVNANLDPANDTGKLTILDDDEMPAVRFESSEYFANDSANSAEITVELGAKSGYDVDVKYDGNRNGINGTLTIPAGSTKGTFTVSTAGTSPGDQIILTLREPSHATLSTPSSAILTILDQNRGDCHSLTLQVVGDGANPAVDPDRSAGCSKGEYVQSELISVTAKPAKGWLVKGWEGTLNDDENSVENVIRMPDADHIVVVTLNTQLFLPNTYFSPYFEGPDEQEPNNTLSAANGPLRPDKAYFGINDTADDRWDIYYFVMPNAGAVSITLSSIPSGHDYQLQLLSWDQKLIRSSDSSFDNGDESITTNLAAGSYYVAVLKHTGGKSTSPYSLRVSID